MLNGKTMKIKNEYRRINFHDKITQTKSKQNNIFEMTLFQSVSFFFAFILRQMKFSLAVVRPQFFNQIIPLSSLIQTHTKRVI